MPAAVPVASDAAGPVYPRAHTRSPAPALVPGFRQFLSHICLRTRHGVLHYSRHPALLLHFRQRPPYSSPRVRHSDPARGGIRLALRYRHRDGRNLDLRQPADVDSVRPGSRLDSRRIRAVAESERCLLGEGGPLQHRCHRLIRSAPRHRNLGSAPLHRKQVRQSSVVSRR